MPRRLGSRLPTRSIRFRILLGTVALLAPILAGFGLAGARVQGEGLRSMIEDHGRALSQVGAASCVEPVLLEDWPVLKTFVDSLVSRERDLALAKITLPNGEVVAQCEAEDSGVRAVEFSAPIFFLEDLEDESSRVDLGTLTLGVSLGVAETAVADAISLWVVEASVVFFVLLLGFGWLTRRLVGMPLARLRAQAGRLADEDLTTPISLQSSVEFEELAAALESMRVRIESSYQDLRDQNTELERLDQVKSSFLAMMSHELRTPMNGIIGFTDELLDTELDPDQREILGTIEQSSAALLQILNDILDFSKIEADELELESVPFDLRQVIEATLALVRPLVGDRDIQLVPSLADDLPRTVCGDPGRLRQVLLNLISNAVKFTPSGTVTVTVTAPEPDRLAVSVADTGIGIPSDKLEDLFEPFKQVDSSHTRRFGGTGLGLTICRRIAVQMGGTLTVESTVDVGSVFHFEAPFPVAVADDQPTEAATAMPRKGLRVLVAEDNPVNQRLVSKLLEKLGASVELAADGAEAIALYTKKRGSWDLVLMDCQMPEVDGYEATRQIRSLEDADATHTPIVAVTADAMAGVREECLAAGMDDYLAKPIRPSNLAAMIARWHPE